MWFPGSSHFVAENMTLFSPGWVRKSKKVKVGSDVPIIRSMIDESTSKLFDFEVLFLMETMYGMC